MNLELILWLVTGFIISEGIFISSFFRHTTEEWFVQKIIAFFIGAGFMFIQMAIVFRTENMEILFDFTNPHYIYLFYEVLIIIGIGILFFINKLIADKLNKRRDENELG